MSDVHILEKSDVYSPGTWTHSDDGLNEILVTCPNCGYTFGLTQGMEGHSVLEEDGNVNYLVSCLNPKVCSFRGFLKLEGYGEIRG